MNFEDTIKKLGIDLDNPASPVANYVPAVSTGKLVYLSGKGPTQSDGTMISGKVGSDLNIDEGYEAARLVGIQLLAALREHIGDLNRVSRIVKVLGMVNSTPDFEDHPKVINGCSDLLVSVFGENGKHARSAVGMGSLPGQIPVEIEMIVEVI
ncbi:MAG: RidA family protein [Chloroflexota bacterium]|nr:RidA family protein [Chloroflexota bacterium]|tara:strand:- start:332 stop:790 length:459 start_codon:yes stop_codon:yes gene_type:complete